MAAAQRHRLVVSPAYCAHQSRTTEMLGSTDSSAEPKRPRHADAGGGGGDASDDRLSALPDDLLRVILSRLKAQQTVRTCVLSTRWRDLWRAVPCLDIARGYTSHVFDDFTAHLLRGHEFAPLEELRLHGATVVVGDRWLRRNIGRDAWPCRLRKLHLSSLRLDLNDLASHISSSGSPALEDVQLKNCGLLLTSNAKIASSSLKNLALVDDEYTVHDVDDFKLFIEAPALASLRLAGDELDHIVDFTQPRTMPSLVDASIRMTWIEHTNQLNILLTLSNVTTLHLSDFDVTLLFFVSHEHLPVFKFENLKSLSLEQCVISDDFLGLRQYLHNSPNLQKLTLHHCQVWDFHLTKGMIERRQSYSKDLVHFNCNNLRLSEIIYGDDDDYVHLLVKCLVGMSTNLPNNKIELTRRQENTQELELTHLLPEPYVNTL